MTEPRDPAASPPDAAPEPRVIDGRYRLGPVIGRGGMAVIHRAHDLRGGHDVAVKLLRADVGRDRDLAQRFRREALAATVLRHPNIVACLDTGTDGGQAYLVMELVEGEDLAARLKRGGRLAPWQAARIALDVARGLGAAHIRGIVHRDVKPGNILLAADGRAMVADFGIARLAADAEAATPGTTLGSVHYFSPEQASGLTTTPASDVYGLGLVLYEMLTGVRAWGGATTDAIALARVGASPPSPGARVTGIPAALDAMVLRALAPKPEDRYPNGVSMATALEPIVRAGDPAEHTDTVTRPVRSIAAAVEPADRQAGSITAPPLVPPSPGAAERSGQARAASISRPRVAGSVAALVVLAVVGGVLGAFLVAALPGSTGDAASGARPSGSGSGVALASLRPTGSPSAVGPTATPEPTPTPTATPGPTATPEPTAIAKPRRAAELCSPFFGLACGLDPGRYTATRFTPAFDIKLGSGWSTAANEADIVNLVRDEGSMTFAAPVTGVDPDGRSRAPKDRARDIVEAFIVTDGVSSTTPAAVRIGGRKGLSVDLATIGSRGIALFTTPTTTWILEPGRTSRLVVIDVRGRAVIIAIEPSDRSDLEALLETADDAAGTIGWR